MRWRQVTLTLGMLVIGFSPLMLLPAIFAVIDGDGTWRAFVYSSAIAAAAGAATLPLYRSYSEVSLKSGYLVLVLSWFILGAFSSLPLAFSEHIDLRASEVLFEGISGLTTTGATVLSGLDDLPRSILFYRQFLQWIGGLGIIVLAVVILPFLGISGQNLYRADTFAPYHMAEGRIRPRLAAATKALLLIYVSLTLACALLYWIAGMGVFDAAMHSLSTVAIGGFSTHDASIGYFDSRAVEVVAMVFMFLSATNFALMYRAVQQRTLKHYAQSDEFNVYIRILVVSSIAVALWLWLIARFDGNHAFWQGAFQTVSVVTTTGFSITDYDYWPSFIPLMLVSFSCIGACSGSSGGGIKVIRVLLLYRQGVGEIKRLIHPQVHPVVKFGSGFASSDIMPLIWGFWSIYVLLFYCLTIALVASGLDLLTAYSAVAACLNNLGPGLGEVASNYRSLSDLQLGILSFTMIAGRLELLTLVVVLTPQFWRR